MWNLCPCPSFLTKNSLTSVVGQTTKPWMDGVHKQVGLSQVQSVHTCPPPAGEATTSNNTQKHRTWKNIITVRR